MGDIGCSGRCVGASWISWVEVYQMCMHSPRRLKIHDWFGFANVALAANDGVLPTLGELDLVAPSMQELVSSHHSYLKGHIPTNSPETQISLPPLSEIFFLAPTLVSCVLSLHHVKFSSAS